MMREGPIVAGDGAAAPRRGHHARRSRRSWARSSSCHRPSRARKLGGRTAYRAARVGRAARARRRARVTVDALELRSISPRRRHGGRRDRPALRTGHLRALDRPRPGAARSAAAGYLTPCGAPRRPACAWRTRVTPEQLEALRARAGWPRRCCRWPTCCRCRGCTSPTPMRSASATARASLATRPTPARPMDAASCSTAPGQLLGVGSVTAGPAPAGEGARHDGRGVTPPRLGHGPAQPAGDRARGGVHGRLRRRASRPRGPARARRWLPPPSCGAAAVALVFDPHPDEVIHPGTRVPRLAPPEVVQPSAPGRWASTTRC